MSAPDHSAANEPAEGVINSTRPLHLRPAYLLLAFLGGAVGSAARATIALAMPGHPLPYATLTVNLVGAFLLGALLTTLTRRGPDEGHRRRLRIAMGTGLMGGFTTYSALAAESIGMVSEGRTMVALGYALATVVLGVVATWAGIAATTAAHDRRERLV